jgi:hypothetical protein
VRHKRLGFGCVVGIGVGISFVPFARYARGFWVSASVPSAADCTELVIGWIVAKAGAATPIIKVMTNATVTSKTIRLISATSL